MHNNNGLNAQLETPTEFKLQRPPQPRRAPQPVILTNDRTRQTTLFDAGQNDLPGQKHLFDDITQDNSAE